MWKLEKEMAMYNTHWNKPEWSEINKVHAPGVLIADHQKQPKEGLQYT